MKFKAVFEVKNGITKGKEYQGQFVVRDLKKYPNRNNGNEIEGEIRIIIFNDNKKWAIYSPSYFEPA